MVECEFFYNRITGRYEDRQEELRFHNFEDYISKYRRVRGYFIAPKVGLTATPALHITDIFNNKTEIN